MSMLPVSLSGLDPYRNDSPTFGASPNIWLLGGFPYRKQLFRLLPTVVRKLAFDRLKVVCAHVGSKLDFRMSSLLKLKPFFLGSFNANI